MSAAVLRPTRKQPARGGASSMSPPPVPGPSASAAAAAGGTAALEVQQPLLPAEPAAPARRMVRSSVNYNAFTTSSLSPDFARHSYPLAISSGRAFQALVVLPLAAWFLAVGCGIAAYQGVPKGQRVSHLMTWFDRGVLRPAGSLVPFAVLAARAGVHVAAYFGRHGAAPLSSRPRLRLGSLLLDCMFIYFVMACLRLVVYSLHFWAMKHRYLEFHLVSDHIFLAATMLICLHTELACLTSDALRVAAASAPDAPAEVAAADTPGTSDAGNGPAAAAASSSRSRRGSGVQQQLQQQLQQQHRQVVASRWELVLLVALAAVACFLYVCTAGDMYYTARFFHFPLESFTTTVVVFFMFQWPMITWLNRMRRREIRAANSDSPFPHD